MSANQSDFEDQVSMTVDDDENFGRCREPAPNEQSYGVGVHLISPVFAYDGALSSAVDERGLRHMLLCRVIWGRWKRWLQVRSNLIPVPRRWTLAWTIFSFLEDMLCGVLT
ncbi:hypothetical protein L3X38_005226 [Prunus dulcis]|uniref:Uncharacterized protein n=1 Tax=Prunus dulcis TaxID=3755 RepID=A0AAD4ZQJ0_PRUDU|nr:hypothetical protein L3X38_005226 [Prunus dulcis]